MANAQTGEAAYAFYTIPYRDTVGREEVRNTAIEQLLEKYDANSNLNKPAALRPIDGNDFVGAGVTNAFKSNTNQVEFTAFSSPIDGYAYGSSLTFTIPSTNAWILYGLSDVSSTINLRAIRMTLSGSQYKRFPLYPELLKSQDQTVYWASPFRVFPPNTNVTLDLLAEAAGTDEIWFKGFVAEQGTKPNTQ